jgi:hypothetical protein
MLDVLRIVEVTMRARSNFLLLLLIGLACAACSGANRERGALPAPNAETVRVTVRNDAFWEANIYLLQGAARRRLGTVSGHSTGTFVLPRHLIIGVSELRFVVDFIGRRDGAVSETILAVPGDEIELTIRE